MRCRRSPFNPLQHRTLDFGLRRLVAEQTSGRPLLEQLYTFGDRNRHPTEQAGGTRLLSIAWH
ncbi:MAG: hypothetical protein U1E38_00920 [Rhodospirillales bacterium]